MQVELKILRYDPERDKKPRWERYDVEADPMSRVLDVLTTVKLHNDGSLTFRRSCAHGVCGSDAMLINGRNRLACKIRVDQLGRKISVAPLPGLPVIKDLVVDMDGFFDKFKSVMPFQIDDGVMPERERLQSPEDRARYDDTTKCILCAACTSSCPSFWAKPEYVGPAAIVNAHRFIFDTRDQGADERLEILSDENGVWRCRTIFNCTDACPRGINITRAILEVSTSIIDRRGRSKGAAHADWAPVAHSEAPTELSSRLPVGAGVGASDAGHGAQAGAAPGGGPAITGSAPVAAADAGGVAPAEEGIGGHPAAASGSGTEDGLGAMEPRS